MTAAHKLYIIPFFASLLICSFSFNLSADTQHIRVSIDVDGPEGDTPSMVSALSREFRKLDGVLVTDTLPELRILCSLTWGTCKSGTGSLSVYTAAIAITDSNARLITQGVNMDHTIDKLAHAIAVNVDGAVIEQMRRAKVQKPTIDDILGPEPMGKESPRPSPSAHATATPSVNP